MKTISDCKIYQDDTMSNVKDIITMRKGRQKKKTFPKIKIKLVS